MRTILIFVRAGAGAGAGVPDGVPVGVPTLGLADFGFGVGVGGGRDELLCPRTDVVGDAAGAPGRGFLTESPEGKGFLAGFATILSLMTGGPALGGAPGRDVRPLTP